MTYPHNFVSVSLTGQHECEFCKHSVTSKQGKSNVNCNAALFSELILIKGTVSDGIIGNGQWLYPLIDADIQIKFSQNCRQRTKHNSIQEICIKIVPNIFQYSLKLVFFSHSIQVQQLWKRLSRTLQVQSSLQLWSQTRHRSEEKGP